MTINNRLLGMVILRMVPLVLVGIVAGYCSDVKAQTSISTINPETINEFNVSWDSDVSDYQKSVIRKIIGNMVKVEGGEFTMGSDGYWEGLPIHLNETPLHSETVTDFYISKYELRWSEWKAIMGEADSEGNIWVDIYNYGDDQPMVNISHTEILEFLEKLKQYSGLNFRLPSESEWEYAAKGGRESRSYVYSGSNDPKEVAWYKVDVYDELVEPNLVGEKQPNELGLYDMSGNVGEIVGDSWRDNYDCIPDDNLWTCRGGDYRKGRMYVHNSFREMNFGEPSICVGFRVAL